MDLSQIVLDVGSHGSPDEGMCVMEAVAWVAGERFSDHPASASEVIAAYMRSINDALFAERLEALVPFVARLVGTAAALDVEVRRAVLCADYAVRQFAASSLDAAGLAAEAAALRALPAVAGFDAARSASYAARSASYAARDAADAINATIYAANAATAASYAATAASYAASNAARSASYAAINATTAASDAINATTAAINAATAASNAARSAGAAINAARSASYAAINAGAEETVYSVALALIERLIEQA